MCNSSIKAPNISVMKNLLFLCMCLFSLLSVIPAANSQSSVPSPGVIWTEDSPNIYVNVYPQKNELEGGETVQLVIEQIIRPHWHTYWKNPGDSGAAMRVRWDLPEGFQASEFKWPTPQKMPVGPLTNYGYGDRVLILQELQIPEDVSQDEINIPVSYDILVCDEICIPETVDTVISFNHVGAVNTGVLDEALAQLPMVPDGWESSISRMDENTVLNVTTDISEADLSAYEIEFFPLQYGLVQNAAQPEVTVEGSEIILKQAKGDFNIEQIEDKGGILVLENEAGERKGYILDPAIKKTVEGAGFLSMADEDGIEKEDLSEEGHVGYILALFFAFLGGLILNLMPCVFPVLSIKVLSLAKMSDHSVWEARKHGLAYTAGIVFSFLLIAGLLILLKSGGSEIGWGFHLQSPVVILLLAYLFFLIGLNLAGYFEFGERVTNIGNGWMQGATGSFFTGILATTVATPCTAPFMAAALGYALLQPSIVALSVFVALGLGLAFPFLLISFIPVLQKAMPRPGQWMVTFKEFLAFPMFLSAVWLFWVLAEEVGTVGILWPVMGVVGVTFGLWMLRKADHRVIVQFLALLIMAISFFFSLYSIQMTHAGSKAVSHEMMEYGSMYSPQALADALASDRPVFVEMTAAWCVTCKFNHRIAIGTPKTKQIIEEEGIIYLVGDWTNYDADITSYLESFERRGVPLYVYYGRPDRETGIRPDPELLPQLLTPGIVERALRGY